MFTAFFDSAARVRQETADSERQIRDQLQNVRRQREMVDQLFNLAEDEDLTEACIYQARAFDAYFRYLNKQLRSQPVRRPAPAQARREVAKAMG